MITVVGIALISALVYVLIKKYSPEYAMLVEISSIVLILLFSYPYICDVIDFFSSVDMDNDYFSLILRITGVAVLTQFAADVCADSGENALADKIEFAGKTIILAMSLPVVKSLLEFATGMINSK